MFVGISLNICDVPNKCKTIQLVTKKKRGRQPKALPALQRQAIATQSDTSIELTPPAKMKSNANTNAHFLKIRVGNKSKPVL